jgi:ABC-type polysaccharide/polyol phosphate export permease
MFVFGKPPTAFALLLPVVLLVQYIFSLGFSLLISALTVHFRDIRDILGNFMTFWFFATPIVYSFQFGPLAKKPALQKILGFNPMTHIIEGYHDCLYYGQFIHWKRLGISLLVSLVLFVIGYAVFDRLRDSFPEEV